MSDEKREQTPADAAPKPENENVSVPEEVDPSFFDEEHDGWSEIKRRPSNPDVR